LNIFKNYIFQLSFYLVALLYVCVNIKQCNFVVDIIHDYVDDGNKSEMILKRKWKQKDVEWW